MSKSHKLFLAALLLGGGYGVALLLGSLSNWIVPQSADRLAERAPVGALVPMSAGEFAAVPLAPPPIASETTATPFPRGFAREARPVSQSPLPAKPLETPTWLAATSPPPADIAVPIEPPAPAPQAKVVDVSPWGTETVAASPWDRWPRWEPSPTTHRGAETAKYDHANDARSQAIQASYQPSATNWADDESDSSAYRTHVVVDGDSLAKLADRYLDDPQLANEIYEFNRGVLANPDLLPIGVELKIPERHMARAAASEATLRGAENSPMAAPGNFVPVDHWLDTANDIPRAQLLQPVAISGER